MSEISWIRVTDRLPSKNARVWGYNCLDYNQDSCIRKGNRLIFRNGDTNCLITHWKPVWDAPPLADAEIVQEMLQSETKRYYPFNDGKTLIDWQNNNCSKCAKYDSDKRGTCDIFDALSVASNDDGSVSEDIAQRMGLIKDNLISAIFPGACHERKSKD